MAAVFQQLEDTAQLAGLQLDQLGRLGVVAVRVGGVAEVAQLGVEQLPALVMFKHGLPIVYTGALAGDTMDTVTPCTTSTTCPCPAAGVGLAAGGVSARGLGAGDGGVAPGGRPAAAQGPGQAAPRGRAEAGRGVREAGPGEQQTAGGHQGGRHPAGGLRHQGDPR